MSLEVMDNKKLIIISKKNLNFIVISKELLEYFIIKKTHKRREKCLETI